MNIKNEIVESVSTRDDHSGVVLTRTTMARALGALAIVFCGCSSNNSPAPATMTTTGSSTGTGAMGWADHAAMLVGDTICDHNVKCKVAGSTAEKCTAEASVRAMSTRAVIQDGVSEADARACASDVAATSCADWCAATTFPASCGAVFKGMQTFMLTCEN